MSEPLFIVSKDDWSLHRKGYQDQTRHQQKVREALKHSLPDLISEENIIMSDGKKIVKVPIRSLDEFKFRYNYNKSKHVGQGNGDSKVGDVLGKDASQSRAPGKGGEQAGDQPGIDYYEAEVNLDELEELLFEDLELPNLKPKSDQDMEVTDISFNDVRKKGIQTNIDKKRTILEAIKRTARDGATNLKITPDDLRYKTWTEIRKPQSNAVIIAMMDTSGSMGQFEKYVARSFFFWMTRFLRQKYDQVEIVFIAHHTEAKEVTEEEFFTKGESGGTICSSAYAKALEIIDSRYSPDRHNIYPFHFSDGDNLTSDNERCVKFIEELMKRSNLFGYGEVNQYNRSSTLMSAYRHIQKPQFRYHIIREKKEVYAALKTFFSVQAG